MFRPKGHNELYGKNGFNKIDRIEFRRDDNRPTMTIYLEIFSATNTKAKGAPSMLCFNMEDATEFHRAFGLVLNPTKKDLE
jgi:hypothetical protein